MRICVYGAGAVGGHLAAKLAASGHAVCVVARGAQLAAIRANGLRLLHGEEEIRARVAASDRASGLGPQELVIVTVKAPALAAFAGDAGALLGEATPVLFAQNGIPWWYASGLAARRPKPPELDSLDPGGRLREAVSAKRIMGAVIYSANDLVAPGVIENHTPGNNMLVVGECDDADSERIRGLRKVLEGARLSSPPTADIRQAVWNKLAINLGTGTVCLLAGCTVGEMRLDPQLAGIAARVRAEARAIAAAHGGDIDSAPERPAGGHTSSASRHKPSILQDYESGRPMELAAQLVSPMAFARAAGLQAPTLEALVPLALHKAAARGLRTT
jgi:2-dehydropantoate 2-reductase